MANRLAFSGIVPFLMGIVACTPPAAEEGASPETSAAEEVVRTADPYKRGYTDEDFPRIQELADGVYSYEQLRSAGEEKFTTVSLFVVTNEGVLVADGQGNPEETTRLVDEIAEITDQPITHVVICSDHGDHTAGNVSFPQEAAFLAQGASAMEGTGRALPLPGPQGGLWRAPAVLGLDVESSAGALWVRAVLLGSAVASGA